MKETGTESNVFTALGLLCAALTQAGVYLFLSRLTQDYAGAFVFALLLSAAVFMLFRSHARTMRIK